jgi:hypothetical protein
VKVFNLKCDANHPFEGWFDSLDAFHDQQARGLLECPLCMSRVIEKTLSAPRLNLSPVKPTSPASTLPVVLEAVRQIVAQSEDVGDRFADEARAMHAKEIPARAIVGQTTLETAQELAEEGIPVMPLPFGHMLTNPLQ